MKSLSVSQHLLYTDKTEHKGLAAWFICSSFKS